MKATTRKLTGTNDPFALVNMVSVAFSTHSLNAYAKSKKRHGHSKRMGEGGLSYLPMAKPLGQKNMEMTLYRNSTDTTVMCYLGQRRCCVSLRNICIFQQEKTTISQETT